LREREGEKGRERKREGERERDALTLAYTHKTNEADSKMEGVGKSTVHLAVAFYIYT